MQNALSSNYEVILFLLMKYLIQLLYCPTSRLFRQMHVKRIAGRVYECKIGTWITQKKDKDADDER